MTRLTPSRRPVPHALRHALSCAALTAAAAVGGAAITSAAAQTATDQSTERANRAVIRRAFDAWAQGGTRFFDDVLAPDVVWTIAGSGPSAGVYRGRQDFQTRAVAPFTARLATPIVPTVRRLWADGDEVIALWDGRATAGDGQPYRNTYAWIFTMRGGRAVAVTAFLDLPAYDAVLARVPPSPRAAPRAP